MSPNYQQFINLHRSGDLFLLPNAWDAHSARVFQDQQFGAVATSSAAVASSLGYTDGEAMPFEEYLFVIRRILSVLRIPLSVDIEMGYGSSDKAIIDNILRLTELGVVGINIEDSTINDSVRRLKESAPFARTIEFIKNTLSSGNLDLFVNIRCDTYILNVDNKQKETAHRVRLYESAGADGIFLPCITDEADIRAAVSQTKLPLNVMSIPGIPDFAALAALGVKRVSMGPLLFTKVYNQLEQLSRSIQRDQTITYQ
jgi:2-methylisocitrate lyase-like PEP mutase family enzyme